MAPNTQRFLIHEHDTKFTRSFDTVFAAEGIETLLTPLETPNANAFAECWVRSVRQECDDHLLTVNEWHLRRIVLSIDAGTEAIKAGNFDQEGHLVASGARSYATYFPRPGWAEQDPGDWWVGLVGAVRDCLAASPVSADAIVGISADATTCTLIPTRANGDPLRPALLWMDVRATEQAARIFKTGHPALCYNLAGVSAEWMPAKALWLKENEPNVFDEAAYLVEYADWLAFRLTGRLALNINTITQCWYYHTPAGWPSSLFEQIGLGGVEARFSESQNGLPRINRDGHGSSIELLGSAA